MYLADAACADNAYFHVVFSFAAAKWIRWAEGAVSNQYLGKCSKHPVSIFKEQTLERHLFKDRIGVRSHQARLGCAFVCEIKLKLSCFLLKQTLERRLLEDRIGVGFYQANWFAWFTEVIKAQSILFPSFKTNVGALSVYEDR
ncbi:MAG TPA: hypothetical protein H9739_01385 [Candidatus Agathobaculum pullistercoris]|nr:hypothetical protein [uncultured Agathobaculum sp.]HIX10220.1 hypothetical protein [Candidatus Agathobaculum pullistercoris]